MQADSLILTLVCKFVECLDHGSITLVKAEETVDNLKEML